MTSRARNRTRAKQAHKHETESSLLTREKDFFKSTPFPAIPKRRMYSIIWHKSSTIHEAHFGTTFQMGGGDGSQSHLMIYVKEEISPKREKYSAIWNRLNIFHYAIFRSETKRRLREWSFDLGSEPVTYPSPLFFSHVFHVKFLAYFFLLSCCFDYEMIRIGVEREVIFARCNDEHTDRCIGRDLAFSQVSKEDVFSCVLILKTCLRETIIRVKRVRRDFR